MAVRNGKTITCFPNRRRAPPGCNGAAPSRSFPTLAKAGSETLGLSHEDLKKNRVCVEYFNPDLAHVLKLPEVEAKYLAHATLRTFQVQRGPPLHEEAAGLIMAVRSPASVLCPNTAGGPDCPTLPADGSAIQIRADASAAVSVAWGGGGRNLPGKQGQSRGSGRASPPGPGAPNGGTLALRKSGLPGRLATRRRDGSPPESPRWPAPLRAASPRAGPRPPRPKAAGSGPGSRASPPRGANPRRTRAWPRSLRPGRGRPRARP